MMFDIRSALPIYVNVTALAVISKLVREFKNKFLDPDKAARKTNVTTKSYLNSDGRRNASSC